MSEKKVYCQRYRTVWENDQRFQGWIQPFPGDSTQARCTICGTAMKAHLKSLLGHCSGKKHLAKLDAAQTKNQEIQSVKCDPESDLTRVSETKKDIEHAPLPQDEHDSNWEHNDLLELTIDGSNSKANAQVTGIKDRCSCHLSPDEKLRESERDTNWTKKIIVNTIKLPTAKKRGLASESLNAGDNIFQTNIRKVSLNEENEFDIFGKYIASQLKQMPLEISVELQTKIQTMVGEQRMQLLRQELKSS